MHGKSGLYRLCVPLIPPRLWEKGERRKSRKIEWDQSTGYNLCDRRHSPPREKKTVAFFLHIDH